MYRYAACEMFQNLRLEDTFKAVSDDLKGKREKRILSKAAWGFFCFER